MNNFPRLNRQPRTPGRKLKIVIEGNGGAINTQVQLQNLTPGQLSQLLGELEIVKAKVLKMYENRGMSVSNA